MVSWSIFCSFFVDIFSLVFRFWANKLILSSSRDQRIFVSIVGVSWVKCFLISSFSVSYSSSSCCMSMVFSVSLLRFWGSLFMRWFMACRYFGMFCRWLWGVSCMKFGYIR